MPHRQFNDEECQLLTLVFGRQSESRDKQHDTQPDCFVSDPKLGSVRRCEAAQSCTHKVSERTCDANPACCG